MQIPPAQTKNCIATGHMYYIYTIYIFPPTYHKQQAQLTFLKQAIHLNSNAIQMQMQNDRVLSVREGE